MMLSFGEAMRAAGAELLRERLQSGASYNPLSSRTAQDPCPVYASLRTRDPVHRSRLPKAWLFTRHADVDAILRDHRHFGNDPRMGTLSSRQHAMPPPSDEFTLLFLDPPDHTRLRALVNKAFTRKAIDDLEPRIRGILGTLLDDLGDPAGFDLMHAVGRPLPVIVIAEMLGVPPEDRERFRIWSARRARLVEPKQPRVGAAVARRPASSRDAGGCSVKSPQCWGRAPARDSPKLSSGPYRSVKRGFEKHRPAFGLRASWKESAFSLIADCEGRIRGGLDTMEELPEIQCSN